jgi:hypothetical protein
MSSLDDGIYRVSLEYVEIIDPMDFYNLPEPITNMIWKTKEEVRDIYSSESILLSGALNE